MHPRRPEGCCPRVRARPLRVTTTRVATLPRVDPKHSSRPPPVTPDALRIEQALRQSEPLARLQSLMRDSNARFDAIRPGLPAGLAPHVKPGPVDDTGWSLLAANASVAAKLRQLVPHLETLLRESGWTVCAVRIKVSAG